jgi:hypothetical protein
MGTGSRRCVLKKKIVVLVGVAAVAAYGAKKLFLDKEEQTSQPLGTTEYGTSGYASPAQDQRAA